MLDSCIYVPQMTILKGGTKDEMRISKEALFKGVSTQFGPLSIEKCFLRNPHFISCSSFQNLRLGSINFTPPKRRFWKAEQTSQNAFSKHFSRAWVLDLGDKTLKSASKRVLRCLFILPKSSFGRYKLQSHKMMSMPIPDVSIEHTRW